MYVETDSQVSRVAGSNWFTVHSAPLAQHLEDDHGRGRRHVERVLEAKGGYLDAAL